MKKRKPPKALKLVPTSVPRVLPSPTHTQEKHTTPAENAEVDPETVAWELQVVVGDLRAELSAERARAEAAVGMAQRMADAIVRLTDRFGFAFREIEDVARTLHRAPIYTHGLFLSEREPTTFRYTLAPMRREPRQKKARKRLHAREIRHLLSADGT